MSGRELDPNELAKKPWLLFDKLTPEEWQIKVDDKWTVKDVVAHLIGWSKVVAESLPEAWSTGEQPWFMESEKYDEFNKQNIENYRDFTPEELNQEWGKWEMQTDEEIKKIGARKIRRRKGFEWVLDEGEDSHYLEHMKQIVAAIVS